MREARRTVYEGKNPAGGAAGSSMLSGAVQHTAVPGHHARLYLSPCLTALGWPPSRGLVDLPARASEFARIRGRSMAALPEVRKIGAALGAAQARRR